MCPNCTRGCKLIKLCFITAAGWWACGGEGVEQGSNTNRDLEWFALNGLWRHRSLVSPFIPLTFSSVPCLGIHACPPSPPPKYPRRIKCKSWPPELRTGTRLHQWDELWEFSAAALEGRVGNVRMWAPRERSWMWCSLWSKDRAFKPLCLILSLSFWLHEVGYLQSDRHVAGRKYLR